MSLEELLLKHWHYESFRPLQKEIMESVLSGHDTLALMPTGGGKSLCYQLPALAMEGITIVVSPLIALMKDQVMQLRQRHIKAACIVSGMSRQEIEVTLNQSIYDRIKLLYVSPERLKSRTFLDHLRQMPVSMIAVDEAHCISQWGYDFRPPYLEIAKIRSFHPQAPVIALTATATPAVVEDIKARLDFRQGRVFQSSFFRDNLSYSVIKSSDKYGQLLRVVRNVGGSGIIYVRNRRRTQEVAQWLGDNGIDAAAYHAGVPMRDREARQKAWLSSHSGVMVATNAFGMGIDKSDVRFVIHLDIPESPEAYFQEAGRAGRDGRRSYAVLIYDDDDVERLRESLEREFPSMQYIKNTYRAVCNYYQIPVGSGQDSRYDFKLEEICASYGMDYTSLFSALKFIEREGLIALPEHNELQSKLYIPIDKETLYRYQVEHSKAGDMMTTVLRLYGGLFTDFTAISERHIAKRCDISETQVCNLLSEMDKQQVVVYQKRTVNPQIVFTAPRIDINSINIGDLTYKELKEAARRRREAMIGYVGETEQCRSRMLLHYFGEEQHGDCRMCDNCIKKNKKALEQTDGAVSEDAVMALLRQQPMTARQLAEMMPHADKENLSSTVRRLLDKNKIKINQDFVMSCISSL